MNLEENSIGRDRATVAFSYYEIFAGFVGAILNNMITLPDIEKNPKIRKSMIAVIMYADAYQGKKFEENKNFYNSLLEADFYEILFIMFKKLKEIGLVHSYKSYGESYFKKVIGNLIEKYDKLSNEDIKKIME